MFYRHGLPYIFVFLWSSAFITAKICVEYATPFALLFTRFALVAIIFGAMMAMGQQLRRSRAAAKNVSEIATPDSWGVIGFTAMVGLLLHGGYLGSVFLALSLGLPAGMAALIVSMQPLLSAFFAIFLFGEAMRRVQWAGIAIGFCGVCIVLVPTIGGVLPASGVAVAFIGLLSITGGTLLQKKIGNTIGLLKGNFIQALAASLLFAAVSPILEDPHIEWTLPFILALSWQILAISIGAYMIFMVLIKRDSMAATSSLLFLVPPTTAILAALWFSEPLTMIGLVGFALASCGVFLVTRYSSPATP